MKHGAKKDINWRKEKPHLPDAIILEQVHVIDELIKQLLTFNEQLKCLKLAKIHQN